MIKSKVKKNKQLGMNYSTASGRLKKDVMFKLIQMCGLDMCFQCGDKISKVDDLSLEHKIPWIDSENPVELFFDLDNVAFSHLSCNVSARRKSTKDFRVAMKKRSAKIRIVSDEGFSWCNHCKKHLPVEEFTENSKHWSGLLRQCIKCRKKIRS